LSTATFRTARVGRPAAGPGAGAGAGAGAEAAGAGRLRRAVLLWCALLAVIGIKTLINPKGHSVYPLFVAGARHWGAGLPLYDVYPGIIDVFEVFRYSPACAIAFAPLAPLPDRLGGLLWNAINLGALAWGLALAARDVLPGRWPPGRLATLLVLVLVGAIRPAWNGQSNPLVAGLLLMAASAIARRRWWPAAALLAAPVYLKLAPIAVALLLAALWPRRLLGRLAAAMAAGALLPFATQSPAYVLAQYRDWYKVLAHSNSTRWPAFRDAWTLWELTGLPVHVPAYRLIQLSAGLATLAWCLRLSRRVADRRALLTATLAMGSAYLMAFGPSVEFPTYVVLAPMVSWAVLWAFEHRTGRAWAVLAYAMTMVLGSEVVEQPLRGHLPILAGVLPLGSLLFAAWLVRHARQLAGPAGTALDLRAPDRDDARARRDEPILLT